MKPLENLMTGRPGATAMFAMTIVVMLLAATASADTIPGGEVSGAWTTSGSPYLITGEIDVPAGATLTIEPGVEVRFQGYYMFLVHGQLLAVGAEADSIVFHAEDPGTGWHGLRFLDTAASGQPVSELAYCRIQDGRAYGSCPANTGGGIYLNHARTEIRHCLITGNEATSGAGSWGGGGIACDYSSEVIITDCHIVGNSTGGDGGGIYLYWSAPTIHDNVITNNSATRGAGISALMYSAADIRGNEISGNTGTAVYLSGSAAWLVNNRIENNGGSGIDCYLCDARIIGNLLAGNDAYRGGGIKMTGCDPWITNNTIADNTASQGGGIFATFHFVGVIVPSLPVLTNNVVYGNAAGSGDQIYLNSNCVATLRYCNVQDLEIGGVTGTVNLVEGNVDLAPLWVGSGDHPYALGDDSPCLDTGTPDCSALDLPEMDLMGHERVTGGCVDIGAYEFAAGVPVPDVALPAAVELLPGYPNPFNPRTTLTFRLPADGYARLEILDARGRRVATVWDGAATAGVTRVVWDGADAQGRAVPSGVYFGRLVAGEVVRTGVMMLVR